MCRSEMRQSSETVRRMRVGTVDLLTRLAITIAGGYGASIVASTAFASLLPIARDQAILAGQMASFAIFAAIALRTFAAATALRAFGGVLLVAAVSIAVLVLNLWLGGPS